MNNPPLRLASSRFMQITFAFSGLLFSGAAVADVYSFTDESGALHFSNVPVDARYRLFRAEPKAARELLAHAASTKAHSQCAPCQGAWDRLIEEAAQVYQLEPALIHAVIRTESAYNPRAISPKGAMGLMQIMPVTAQRYQVADPFDPQQNIEAGAQYLKDLLALFDQDLKLALAAYNAGENAVIRYGRRIPPFQETLRYVPTVLRLYKAYRRA
jgi:soluble lytic murein transglycosylase-like protein